MNTVKVDYLNVDKATTTIPHPTIHHPISDAILTMTDPFQLGTGNELNSAEIRLNGYIQAMTHMGLMYVSGMTPELATSHVGDEDIRNGEWFPAYRAKSASENDLAYSYAAELLMQNKFCVTTTTVDADTGVVSQTLGAINRENDPHKTYLSSASYFSTLGSSSVTNLSQAKTADRVIFIKDASGAMFFCPLIKPGINWHGPIIRPPAFGGAAGRSYMGHTDSCQKFLSASDVHATFLTLKDGGVTPTTISPKLKSPPGTAALTSSSTGKDVINLMFLALAPVLPDVRSKRVPISTVVYSALHTSEVKTREMHIDHVLVDGTKKSSLSSQDSNLIASTGGALVTTLPKPSKFITTDYFVVDSTDAALASALSTASDVSMTKSPIFIG